MQLLEIILVFEQWMRSTAFDKKCRTALVRLFSCLDFYLARKRIAEAAVGFDPQRRVRIGFELVSQVADVDVDDAARAQDVIAPNALKQLFAAQNLTAVLGQVVQQFEFFWRQLKIFSVLDGAKRIEAQRDAV